MNKHMPITSPTASIEGRVLSKALKPITWIVGRSANYPILSTVRLTLNKDGLHVVGTDLDVEVSTALDVISGEGEFDICVAADVLASIARAAGPSVMTFRKCEKTARDGKGSESVLSVSVDAGAAEYEIDNIFASDAFPALPGERGVLLETFTNGMLANALRRCQRFISSEETRYYLNGVCWVQNDKGREFVATDGHRMVRYSYAANPGDGIQRIIPRKTVALLTRFFAGADVAVHAVGDIRPQIEISTNGYTIRSKLIDGEFPTYTRVIPKVDAESHCIVFSKAGLSHALRLASAIPGSSAQYGRAIHVHPREGLLCLKFNSADTGSAVAHTTFPWPEGVPDFGLNAQYLSDILATCEGEARFVFKDAGHPILILDGDETMTRVQMPMRV